MKYDSKYLDKDYIKELRKQDDGQVHYWVVLWGTCNDYDNHYQEIYGTLDYAFSWCDRFEQPYRLVRWDN